MLLLLRSSFTCWLDVKSAFCDECHRPLQGVLVTQLQVPIAWAVEVQFFHLYIFQYHVSLVNFSFSSSLYCWDAALHQCAATLCPVCSVLSNCLITSNRLPLCIGIFPECMLITSIFSSLSLTVPRFEDLLFVQWQCNGVGITEAEGPDLFRPGIPEVECHLVSRNLY